MTNYIEFSMQDGGTVIIEAADVDDLAMPTGGEVLATGKKEDKVLAKAQNTFDSAVDNVCNAADLLLKKIKALHDAPDDIEVTFGLTPSGLRRPQGHTGHGCHGGAN